MTHESLSLCNWQLQLQHTHTHTHQLPPFTLLHCNTHHDHLHQLAFIAAKCLKPNATASPLLSLCS